jgi:hypothetical protein
LRATIDFSASRSARPAARDARTVSQNLDVHQHAFRGTLTRINVRFTRALDDECAGPHSQAIGDIAPIRLILNSFGARRMHERTIHLTTARTRIAHDLHGAAVYP